jgi:ribonucleoside-triphosphate reductase
MSNFLPTDYQTYIATSRYSRWLEAEQRRELWPETVARYFDFMTEHLAENNNYNLSPALRSELEDAVLSLQIMPSMRALMTAGPALKRNHTAGYNCSFLPVDSLRAFDEAMFILMCGTGVGFSVEARYVEKLPAINEHFEKSPTKIIVADSKEGWCRALRELVAMLYAGQIPTWDVSGIRPAGARLKTFGGRASGPEPLVSLFDFVTRTVSAAKGRRLTSLECHDIMCKIGEVVVVGGVRRSAMISLSDISDDRMRLAKSGNWWQTHSHRALANNSYVIEGRPDVSTFLGEWHSLYDSHSGERGIFSREASRKQAARNGRRESDWDFGTNPCSEIILRPYQFCNLSEAVVRATDQEEELADKVRLATILGTFQSTLTNFKYLRKIWTTNTEEERLLGVSLTGIMDSALMNGRKEDGRLYERLKRLRDLAVTTNADLAADLKIPQSAAITCVKPSGTVSQLTDAASGIHARHSEYYIRTVRSDNKDPITAFLKDAGVPWEPCVMQPQNTTVFSFPMKAPDGAVTRNDLTAIDHLELWNNYAFHWCEHKPSVTITYKDDEFMEVGSWVWENLDYLSGVSFLPHSDHVYKQAPYQEVDKDTYNALKEQMPARIDWTKLREYEREDMTTGSQELACVAGGCEI